MMRAYRVHKHGDESFLTLENVPVPEPGPGEVRVAHRAVGVNFIDIYHRSGLYPLPLPTGIGLEAAGEIDAVGEGVEGWRQGDRVAYAGGPPGAYADGHVVKAEQLIRLPESVSFEQAAALMLKGLTSAYLLHETYPVKAGETILWHAAAGGVGLIACQWAKALGVRVIGTAGSPAKAELARANGCDEVILYDREDVASRVRELTGGRGVPVVYDSVGKDTFDASLDCLAPRGLMVSYGNASGAVTDFSPLRLAQKGSLYLTRPTLAHYASTPAERQALADKLFSALDKGWIEVAINHRYALSEAASAQRALARRETTGASVLIP
ncbi:quinone oxidoreductase family protein [Marinimicrobium alkaliphilum]|uniref:quinone oxidoreductase family protein n=1 Tax=Marinimicrobium alkaliphilum TaxID=2202654 RepID=UPI000DB9E71B|nr:quinone oxidoreductase [Marinimicrobium alkaliphilum]